MLEIITQLPIQTVQVINSINIYTLKYKLTKFMDITQFYDLVIACLNFDYKKRPDANKVFTIFYAILALWLFGEDTNGLIYRKYKLGESVPVDSHQHSLILSNAEMRGYNGDGWYCSILDGIAAFVKIKIDIFLIICFLFNAKNANMIFVIIAYQGMIIELLMIKC